MEQWKQDCIDVASREFGGDVDVFSEENRIGFFVGAEFSDSNGNKRRASIRVNEGMDKYTFLEALKQAMVLHG